MKRRYNDDMQRRELFFKALIVVHVYHEIKPSSFPSIDRKIVHLCQVIPAHVLLNKFEIQTQNI